MPGRNAIDWLENEHRLQQELCDVLEEIADTLPGPIEPAQVEFATTVLRTSIGRHIAILTHLLFPVLRERALANDEIKTFIGQITADNAADEVLAYDTADQLEAAADKRQAGKPDMLAYMLRGMFEGRRRHIAWEMSVLIPLARERLRPEDLETINDQDIRSLLVVPCVAETSSTCGCLSQRIANTTDKPG